MQWYEVLRTINFSDPRGKIYVDCEKHKKEIGINFGTRYS